MAETEKDFADLNAFFDAARGDASDLPDGLVERIIADANLVQDQCLSRVRPVSSGSIWQQFLDMLGGWPGVGGLATACAAGVWLGFAPPAILPDPVQLVQTEPGLFSDDNIFAAMSEEG